MANASQKYSDIGKYLKYEPKIKKIIKNIDKNIFKK